MLTRWSEEHYAELNAATQARYRIGVPAQDTAAAPGDAVNQPDGVLRMPAAPQPPAPSTYMNVPHLAELGTTRTFMFRGRAYLVPATPALEGVQLQRLQIAVTMHDLFTAQTMQHIKWLAGQPASPEGTAAMEAALDAYSTELRRLLAVLLEAATILNTLVRPATWADRVLWRWRGSPFTRAETEEITHALDFFSRRRTTSPVPPQAHTPGEPVEPQSPPM